MSLPARVTISPDIPFHRDDFTLAPGRAQGRNAMPAQRREAVSPSPAPPQLFSVSVCLPEECLLQERPAHSQPCSERGAGGGGVPASCFSLRPCAPSAVLPAPAQCLPKDAH